MTAIAERIAFGFPTEADSQWEIWLGANLYRYRTDGKAVHVVEGMNHAHEQRVTSEPIKLALAAIVELQIQLNDQLRQRTIKRTELNVKFDPISMDDLGNKNEGKKHPYMFGAGYNSAVASCGCALKQACAVAGITLNLESE